MCSKRAYEVVRDQFFEAIYHFFRTFPAINLSAKFDINTDFVIKTPIKTFYQWKAERQRLIEHFPPQPDQSKAKVETLQEIEVLSDDDNGVLSSLLGKRPRQVPQP